MKGVLDRLFLPIAMLKVAITRPSELVDRIDGRREIKRQKSVKLSSADVVSPNRTDPLAAAHELLGIAECMSCPAEFSSAERDLLGESYEVHRFDGGTALIQSLWVVVRHMKPERVVETGVARGVSSAFVLEALERNGDGHLWSIDLPPVRYSAQVKVGVVVPDRLRSRWVYIRGASRRHLPRLLEDLDGIDVFIHDGLHTLETMTFEFHHVWPYMKSGGVVVADDANINSAFAKFSDRVGRVPLAPIIHVAVCEMG